MEYQIPGPDVRTLVVQAFIAIAGVANGFKNGPCNMPSRGYSVLDFLEPTLRSERTLQSTPCKPLSFHNAPI
eukprot:6332122-Amphidinium_carterae.1